MIVLGIDTATTLVSVAIIDADKVLAASESLSDRRHAEDLTPMVEFVVRRAGLEYSDLDAIAVDVGPGLFTGMRVGIASAQAMAHVLNVPLVAIDGLDALVAGAMPSVGEGPDIVVPTIDARRGEVAWAVHRRHDDERSMRVDPPTIGTLEDLVAAVRDRAQACHFVGGFALDRREDLREALGVQAWGISFGEATDVHPHAKFVASLAHDRLMRGEAEEGDMNTPPRVDALYLREADAEINWSTRSRP